MNQIKCCNKALIDVNQLWASTNTVPKYWDQ